MAALVAASLWLLVGCQATPSPSPTATARTVAPSATAVAPSLTPRPTPITGRIAFVHNLAEPGDVPVTDIWLIDARGGQPAALTTGPENEFTPFWLLDGSRLVFAVFDFRTEGGPYNGTLVSVLPDGSDRRDLAPVKEFGDAVLSPDGRYVAWGGGGTAGITLLDRFTGEATVLGTDGATDPIWSPDGTALLVREPYLDAVAVIEILSGHLTTFRKPDIDEVVGWTADGQSVVFSGSETWMAPAGGGSIVAVPATTEMARPTWRSPDGRWVVGPGLEVQLAAGGDPVDLAPGLTMLTSGPSWSPDASALTFAGSTSDEAGQQKSAIYVVSLGGSTPIRITTGPLDTSPTWALGR